MSKIINLSNPDQPLANGDRYAIVYPNGTQRFYRYKERTNNNNIVAPERTHDRIAPRSFEARLTDTEFASLTTKTIMAEEAVRLGTYTPVDPEYFINMGYLKAEKQLNKAFYVDVTNPETEANIDFLISQGDIDPSRKDDLLALGTEEEAYNT